MNILVCIQTVFNPEEQPKLDENRHFILHEDEEFLIPNDFDLIALEAALQIKDLNPQVRVFCFSAGSSPIALRKALAMGADEAYWLEIPNEQLDARSVAHILEQFLKENPFDLILMGKMGVVYESQETPQILAKRLNIPCYSNAFDIKFNDHGKLYIQCESNSGELSYEAELPSVVTADLRLAEPRFANLRGMIRAKSKPFHCLNGSGYAWIKPNFSLLEAQSKNHERDTKWLDMQGLANLLEQNGVVSC